MKDRYLVGTWFPPLKQNQYLPNKERKTSFFSTQDMDHLERPANQVNKQRDALPAVHKCGDG